MPHNPYRITLALSTIITLVGCDPADQIVEDAEAPDEELRDAELDAHRARLAWDGPVLSPDDPTILPAGDWDVMALSDALSDSSLERVLGAARRTHGAVLFAVQEADHKQFVVALPHGETRAGSALFDEIGDVLTDVADPKEPRKTVCNRLYRHPYWSGSQFMICGAEASGGHGYSNLGAYGFDNVASSFFIDSTTNDLSIYNSTGFKNFIVTLIWDNSWFPDSYNDKASSIYGTY